MLEGHNRKYLQTGGTKMPLPVTLILASPLDREAGPECDFLSRSSRCLLLTLPVSEFGHISRNSSMISTNCSTGKVKRVSSLAVNVRVGRSTSYSARVKI